MRVINLNKININIDCSVISDTKEIQTMGGESPKGTVLGVNNRCFTKDGKPWFPIMGEFHFSRYPNEFWEESILKMKAGGVQLVATYIFWLHHEEMEGEFLWQGNMNLGEFVTLCMKHDMQVLLRIGPWAHGECRNGGFPDWLLKKDMIVRSNDEQYLFYTKRFYSEIFMQIEGKLFKDGGPIIGIQLENEYGHCGGATGEEGLAHMKMLKKMAVEIGYDVPFYTATGWGGGIVVDGEMLPVLGAYADAPWADHIQQLQASQEFIFSRFKNETNIGTDFFEEKAEGFTYDISEYPFATAELGGGIQVTHHRRPIISAHDTEVLALTKLGSGANLLGYYMYHGGTNPVGRLSTFQESKETGYSNDLPVLSYDFQAPIGEYGQITDSYKHLKLLHMFLADFGDLIASTVYDIPEKSCDNAEDVNTLRYSIRYGKNGGFVFINNYQRHSELSHKNEIEISVNSGAEHFRFTSMDIPSGTRYILPFNMNLGGVRLLTSTAQLLCSIEEDGNTAFIFFAYENENPTFSFSRESITKIVTEKGSCIEEEKLYKVYAGQPGYANKIVINLESGKCIKFYTIARRDAENLWKCNIGGRERLILTNSSLINPKDYILMTTRKSVTKINIFPDIDGSISTEGAEIRKVGCEGDFAKYEVSFLPVEVSAIFKEIEEKADGTKQFKLDLKTDFSGSVSDNFLRINYEGDIAKLLIQGELSADWFYTGLEWDIGLKRFRNRLKDEDIRVEITKLDEKAYVYLEKHPSYINGEACRIVSSVIEPEYSCKLFLESN